MADHPLTHTLTKTFATLDDLIQRDTDARAHAQAQERLAFLTEQIQTLHNGLRRLKLAVLLARRHDHERTTRWRATRAELKQRAPAAFHSPGRALVDSHLDLLQLVEYTAASVAVVNERYHWVIDQLTHCQHVVAWSPASDDHDMRRARIDRTVSQLASAKDDWRVDTAWQCFEAVLKADASAEMPDAA